MARIIQGESRNEEVRNKTAVEYIHENKGRLWGGEDNKNMKK